jgi:hypothetical protein
MDDRDTEALADLSGERRLAGPARPEHQNALGERHRVSLCAAVGRCCAGGAAALANKDFRSIAGI